MSKIGRNDPCSCGSGKKYKKCCLSKASPAEPSSIPAFARTRLYEQAAFALLLEGSDAFGRYYADVRSQLPDFVVVHDPVLPIGIRARTTRSGGTSYLRVRTPVCPLEDARLIAHELGHLLQDKQGFPAVGGLNDHQAAAALNSAVHDPLIDASLEEHGFDCSADRLAEIEESRRQLSKIAAAPSDLAGKAHWIANCLGHLLDQHVLGKEPTVSEFLEWFELRYPTIAVEARKLANEVISIGFDTPDTMMVSLGHARGLLKAGGGVISPPELPGHNKP